MFLIIHAKTALSIDFFKKTKKIVKSRFSPASISSVAETPDFRKKNFFYIKIGRKKRTEKILQKNIGKRVDKQKNKCYT